MNRLQQKLDLAGTVCGMLGAASCLLAVLLRAYFGSGNFAGMHVAPRSILLGGVALLVFGCWLKLTAK